MPKKKQITRTSLRDFSEKFFPARPQELLGRARSAMKKQLAAPRVGLPVAANRAYINWLKRESMLGNANKQALKLSGTARLWQKPYAKPRPRSAVRQASVWYTAYPISAITKNKTSILHSFSTDTLWSAFEKIGIKAVHTGPMKMAGGIDGWTATASVDGHFDRIGSKIDPEFGTEAEFRKACEVAAKHHGIIVDDIVPGHTGKGPDFRLAEMHYADYPGIYHMIEIDPQDWHLLPDIPKKEDSRNLSPKAEEALKKRGYIIGKLQRVIFYEEGVKETNWSATRIVRGVDGVKRRWVYLHYFKDGQPSINWLDPSFAGMKLVIGDALHSITSLGTKGVRLDANGFLGLEKNDNGGPAWSEGHPLSVAANHLIASMVRKVGGFTFQELNLSIEDIKVMSADGADLSYDFITRPAYHHAAVTQDAEFLRLTMRESLDIGIDAASLVHALQNHDDLTFELIHFWSAHSEDMFEFRGGMYSGKELTQMIRSELSNNLVGPDRPYNMLFTTNGIACTTASLICAVLGIKDLDDITEADVEAVKKIHLLFAMFNSLQPGVFALSGWDLVGALTLHPEQIKQLLHDGDTRWISRGAYDLMGENPNASKSSSGMPRARSLYGSLPEQLADKDSFARQLQRILTVRDTYHIATSKQLDIPDVPHKAMFAMVHLLDETDTYQVTVLNFSDKPVKGRIRSSYFSPNAVVTDMFSNEQIDTVGPKHGIAVALGPYEGTSLLISMPA